MRIYAAIGAAAVLAALAAGAVVGLHERGGTVGMLSYEDTTAGMPAVLKQVEHDEVLNRGQVCYGAMVQGVDAATRQFVAVYEDHRGTGVLHQDRQAVRDYISTLCVADLVPPTTPPRFPAKIVLG